MVQYDDILIAYLIIGAVMLGGGAIQWDDSGPLQFFASNDDGQIVANEANQGEFSEFEKAIRGVVNLVAGPLILIWNLISGLVTYLNWPIFVLTSNNAPPMIVLVLGVPFNAAFYLSLLKLIRSSS